MSPTENEIPADGQPSEKRPHLLFLNRSYWPDSEATGQLLTELTTDLTQWFDVTVIAGRPNHVDEAADPQAITAAEYRGVNIHRVWHTRFTKHSKIGRLANLLTFTLSAWRAASRLRREPDVIIVQTDPFFLPLIGRRLQRRFGNCPLVCYLQDLYPDIAIAVGKVREGRITRTIRNWLFKTYSQAESVIVLSRDMQRRCESYGVPPDKIEVIANWADTNEIRPIKANNAFRKEHNLENRFVIMYSGNMGLAHDLNTLIDAAVLLRDRSDMAWIFIGDGAQREALTRRVAWQVLTNVRFLPYQPRSSLAQSLSAADVHLVSVLPGATACVMPSKLYGILASGTPALAIVEPETELCELINAHQIGFSCLPGDPECLAERICELASSPDQMREFGSNARRLALAHFSRVGQTARFGELLGRLLGPMAPDLRSNREAGFPIGEIDELDIAPPDSIQPVAVPMKQTSHPRATRP